MHFLREEVVWECNSVRHCECGTWRNNDFAQKTEYTQLLANKDDLAFAFEEWQDIVISYTLRKLTFHQDTLPALSGVASQIQTPGLGRYLAGLWEHNLIFGLLWYSFSALDSHRPPQASYTSPSFSWASRSGGVRWAHIEHEMRGQRMTILEATCNVHQRNEWGIVTNGFLNVHGPLITAMLVPYETPLNEEERAIEGHIRLDLGNQLVPVLMDTLEDIKQYLGTEVVCLGFFDLVSEGLANDDEFCWTHFLVLVPLRGGIYSRVGLARTLQSPFEGVPDVDINIV